MKSHRGINYYSNEMQDVAALKLFQNQHAPTFLDIGCRHPVEKNNTLLLEENDWSGICVDIKDYSEEFKEKRQSPFYQIDSTSDEFMELLEKHFPEKIIHYISLDVDGANLQTLNNLLENGFRFVFMTFEHDYHYVRTQEVCGTWYGGERSIDEVKVCKSSSTDILKTCGYNLLFENVSFYEDITGLLPHAWEDWWINPFCFKSKHLQRLDHVSGKNMHFKDCVDRIDMIVNFEIK
tara:strand:+ start:2136 stop:2843 length:708 start_codon:yes stop_codon:yes gene_type:complete